MVWSGLPPFVTAEAEYLGDGELDFHRTHDGAEVDYVVVLGSQVIPYEVKWTDKPRAGDARHIERLRGEGINLQGSSNLIQCSVITHNNTGILVSGGLSGNSARQNQISDNTFYGVNSASILDAEFNY